MNKKKKSTLFEFPACILSPSEYAKIISEINSNYGLYQDQPFCVHYSIGTDNHYYEYFFENHGFKEEFTVEELIKKLNEMPNSYFGFVAGIVTYTKKKPERLEKVLDYINSNNELSPSDVVKFVMMQPDFHEDGLSLKEKVG